MNPIPHNRIVADDRDVDAVAQVVRSGHWATGRATEQLERKLAAICARKWAIVVASGSSALRLSLLALGLGPQHKVGVPAYSCVALANAVASIGADPIPLDCDPHTLNVSPQAARAFTCQLQGMLVVNTFGLPADFDRLSQLGVPLIEDCAHGFGRGRLGRQGVATVLSLYATKFVGSGRGGAILTDDDVLAGRLRDLREYDDKLPSNISMNDKPDDLNAALANSRLSRLEDTIVAREKLAGTYQAAFASAAKTRRMHLPIHSPNRVWYRYTLATPDATTWIARLREKGVEAVEPVFNWLDAGDLHRCANAADAYRSIISLPLFPTLTAVEQESVIDAVLTIARESM